MPTFYCNYFLLGTRGPLTLGGPLDFAYPAYPIVTPLTDVTWGLQKLRQNAVNFWQRWVGRALRIPILHLNYQHGDFQPRIKGKGKGM